MRTQGTPDPSHRKESNSGAQPEPACCAPAAEERAATTACVSCHDAAKCLCQATPVGELRQYGMLGQEHGEHLSPGTETEACQQAIRSCENAHSEAGYGASDPSEAGCRDDGGSESAQRPPSCGVSRQDGAAAATSTHAEVAHKDECFQACGDNEGLTESRAEGVTSRTTRREDAVHGASSDQVRETIPKHGLGRVAHGEPGGKGKLC